MTKLVTVTEAAQRLSLKPATIRKMIFQRRVPVVKIGRSVRIKEEDLEAIIRRGYQPAMEELKL
jgi:excisionase family DNA binding protein